MEPTDGDARPHPLDRQPQLRKNGQLMSRLVLLASATAPNLVGLRASNPRTHAASCVVRLRVCRSTATAPAASESLRSRSKNAYRVKLAAFIHGHSWDSLAGVPYEADFVYELGVERPTTHPIIPSHTRHAWRYD
jgi:hypothetical protein